jgi:hypothetical protein
MPVVEIGSIDTHLAGWTAAEARLHAMERALENMHDPLEGIVGDVHRHTLEQFASWGDVSGTPWEPLAASTIREKEAHHYPAPGWPLVATGALMASATTSEGPFSEGEVLEQEAWLGVDWEEGGYQIPVLHQEGVPWTEVHRRAYTRADGVEVGATSYMWHLPARPIFTVTDELADKGAARIAAHVWNPLA